MPNVFEQIKIPIISICKQKEIAYKLDTFEKYINEINGLSPKEIELIEKIYNYLREKYSIKN
ncbi:hypothetical protein [Mycoplasmopsis columbina]|uniref:hypothetical protein n=1 Tax=Mycoplasmopsis columbina TaxID=114881 RepID=UPI0004A6FC64|nr:hypothetical protein [Mycoplasmopsis columbina]VEU77200.1 Uncharacterised protein [Mycoplasmopsis columbina]